ncbi:hypothetical protein ABT095_36585 [Kitasatospora sp. NPDC002227]|uniref:hypothetical protein n=1 Tax=Kitasatospora sp. NPDC002227 TaxID=3154773 RepID=UPI0033209B90
MPDTPPGDLPAGRPVHRLAVRLEFAARLYPLFKELGLSVRAYGHRRHLSGTAVQRYIKGQRLPAQKFLTDLFEDLAASGRLVGEAERADLLRLYEQALHGGRPEQLDEAQLNELRAELADCQQQQADLVTQLREREVALERVESRLRRLKDRRTEERIAHAEQLAARLAEYQEVEDERDRLRREVEGLRDELVRERAWFVSVMEQCQHLYWQTESRRTVQEPATFGSLLSGMDSAPVGELVGFVAGADDKHRPVVTELLRAAGRHRPVPDAVTLFVALHEAGTPQHAEVALPAAIIGRGVPEVADLIDAFTARRLDSFTATVVGTFVEHHTWQEIAELVAHLHARGLAPEPADTVAAAAVVVREPAEVAALLIGLGRDHGLTSTVLHCLDTAVQQRSPAHLVALARQLEDANWRAYVRELTARMVQHHQAQSAAEYLSWLPRAGLGWLADETFAQLIRFGDTATLVDLLSAPDFDQRERRLAEAKGYAAHSRTTPDVVELVQRFDERRLQAHGAELLIEFLQCRRPGEALRFAELLDLPLPGTASRLLLLGARQLSTPELKLLLHRLHVPGLSELHTELLVWVAGNRSPAEAAELLVPLPAVPADAQAVLDAAADRDTPSVAQLFVCWRAASRDPLAHALLATFDQRFPLSRANLRLAVSAEEERRGIVRKPPPPTGEPAAPAPGRTPARHARTRRPRADRLAAAEQTIAELADRNAQLVREMERTREQLARVTYELEVESARRAQLELAAQPYPGPYAPLPG